VTDHADTPLLEVPLQSLHKRLGAKLVPFAGYAMPVQYPEGILTEHRWTRESAGLFDVSHMGQLTLKGANASSSLERLVPGDIQGLGQNRTRYTLFTNEEGGILDDLMVSNLGDRLFLVVNAACKIADTAHLKARLGPGVEVIEHVDWALLALQGPKAAAVMARLSPESASMPFMSYGEFKVAGLVCRLTRSGYTGEDGFEISVAATEAEKLAEALLACPEVKPVGLGARDTLRLEAGLCLYGSDIDTKTTPIEAGLAWTIGKRRREEGGFPGDSIILGHLKNGAPRRRVGVLPEGKAPARAHTEITDATGKTIGEVTSGGFGPSLDGPLAMGYVEAAFAAIGTSVNLMVRGTPRPAKIVAMPFVAHRYFK
jgi:aminomethyltransferase